MMKRQMSFAEAESAGKKRVTRRQRFLDEMEKRVPWSRLLTAIVPYYPKGGRGRLTRKLFDEIGILLCERGLMMKEGTLVDATIIEAPSSTKNADKSRDPEMHQTKKGNAWHFGMRAHLGVDADSGLVHSVVGTAANVSDVSQAHALLHGHEEEAFGDAGYIGVDKRDEIKGKLVKWRVTAKRGKIKAMQDGPLKDLTAVERTKAQIRARVEHPFHIVKNLFHYRKVRYKGHHLT